jgi:hypothetical protein
VVATLERSLAGPTRPLGSPEIPQFYLPTTGESGIYRPCVYGSAHVQFADRRRKIDEARRVAFRLFLDSDTRTVDWDVAEPIDVLPEALLSDAPRVASYLPLPAGAMDVKVFTRWARQFDRWLARTQRLAIPALQTAPDSQASIGPKRGGVSVDLVALAWDLR